MPDSQPADAYGTPEERAERVRLLVVEGARLLAERRPGEAATRLSEAHQLDPLNVPAAINLGGAYILQGKYRLAVPVLEAASMLEPDNSMIWSNLAAAYLGTLPLSTSEDQNRAIQAYQRALALDPRAPHIHYNLGLIYLERKDFTRAAAQFEEALQIDPADRDARMYLDKLRRGDLGQ